MAKLVAGSNRRQVLLNRPDSTDKQDKELLTQTAVEQVFANNRFRELVTFFESISYLHLVPQLLRERQQPVQVGIAPDHFGRDLLNQIRKTQTRSRDSRLLKIAEILKIVVEQFEGLGFEIDEEGSPRLRSTFKHWRAHGAKQLETQFSDGTLRLIGLLWSLQEQSGPLLLEEPELSLHVGIVRQLAPFIHQAQKLTGRQVIMSTHSEQLLQDEGIAAEEVLLVRPIKEGSDINSGAKLDDVVQLMETGLTAGETIMPKTASQKMKDFGGARI